MPSFPSNFDSNGAPLLSRRWIRQKADNSKVLHDVAETQVGVWEWRQTSPVHDIDEHLSSEVGNQGVKFDKSPGCAAFVGSVLSRVGLPNSGSPLALSYTGHGTEVPLQKAKKGDIVVLNRGVKSWQGHVGFYHTHDDRRIWVLGVNNSDEPVNVKPFLRERLVSVRRME